MSPRVTKSKNLDIYPYFFKYDDPNDIPFASLARKLVQHPNKFRGMIRPARHNSTIYTALRKKGYKDSLIPKWFARPTEPLRYRKAAAAGSQASAEKRSVAEARPRQISDITPPSIVVQEEGAERPSGLSTGSAPQAGVYRLVQPLYRSPLDPITEWLLGQIQDINQKDLMESVHWRKRRRDPPKPLSFDVIKAQVEAQAILQQKEAWVAALMMYILNQMNAGGSSENVDVKEFEEALAKVFGVRAFRNVRANMEWSDMFEAVGSLLSLYKPSAGPIEDFICRYEAALRKMNEGEWTAWLDLGKVVVEKRRQKNWDLEMMKYQSRNLFEKICREITLRTRD